MLTPHRFMDLNYSIINVTSILIDYLQAKGSGSVNDILLFAKSDFDEINEQDILLAFGFLYLLGKVDYSKETDLIYSSDSPLPSDEDTVLKYLGKLYD
ncbi:hypothetical protein ONF83_004092 [Vibrio parahaemolyticus]|nr:hypothetical protein [Vibrio parahaemolyticus]